MRDVLDIVLASFNPLSRRKNCVQDVLGAWLWFHWWQLSLLFSRYKSRGDIEIMNKECRFWKFITVWSVHRVTTVISDVDSHLQPKVLLNGSLGSWPAEIYNNIKVNLCWRFMSRYMMCVPQLGFRIGRGFPLVFLRSSLKLYFNWLIIDVI